MSKVINNRLGVQMDIIARKGADFDRRYHAQLASGDTYVDFAFETYTGATIQVRKKAESPFIELEFSTTDGSIALGGQGRFRLTLSYEDMDKIRSGKYHYDMYLSNSEYMRRDFLYGSFIIEDKITR